MIDAVQERNFEKNYILRQREKYMKTDSLSKYKSDSGYRAKVDILESFLKTNGYTNELILDVGSNTSGESEVLVSKGYNMVATDINEIALSISKERCNKFKRKSPIYFAVDSHKLPFADSTFNAIIAFEVLHHFEKLNIVMKELNRVLKPGGKIFTFEPYALNPYRRLAELRFLILGSIEKSFTVKGLKNKFQTNGFNVLENYKHILPPSEWKKNNSSFIRAFLKELYFRVRKMAPFLFGDLVFIAEKSCLENSTNVRENIALENQLKCPVTNEKLVKLNDGFASQGTDRYFYRTVNEIPVLISDDAVKL
jgi:ubiquinone/menaquinone biosynthesis C-methylase UbiE